MGFKEAIDAAWQEQLESQSVQKFRVVCEDLDNNTINADVELDAIIDKGTFGTVANPIKAEGQIVRALIKQFRADMAEHNDFIHWKQPE